MTTFFYIDPSRPGAAEATQTHRDYLPEQTRPAPRHHKRAGQSSIIFSVRLHTANMMAVSYIPRRGRNVLLLSTRHREPEVAEVGKPTVILDYNIIKGGVDNLDKVWTLIN